MTQVVIRNGNTDNFTGVQCFQPPIANKQVRTRIQCRGIKISRVDLSRYRLITALSLRSHPWRLVTNAVTINGTNHTVSVTTTNPAQFFRLRKS